MATFTPREGLGRPLTYAEADENFEFVEEQAQAADQSASDARDAKNEAEAVLQDPSFVLVSSKMGVIEAVADNEANITAVGSNISSVNNVVVNMTSIKAVENNSANISTVAGNEANINTVAGNNTNINTVAGISSSVTTVANIDTDVATVAANVAGVNSVAANMPAVLAAEQHAEDAATSAGKALDSEEQAQIYAAAAQAAVGLPALAGNAGKAMTVKGDESGVEFDVVPQEELVLVTQMQAEEGTGTDILGWSPERVKQAAVANSIPVFTRYMDILTSGTFTPPHYPFYCRLEAVGGGGGGGASSPGGSTSGSTIRGAGGGGGGGGYVEVLPLMVIGQGGFLTLTVGAAGVPGEIGSKGGTTIVEDPSGETILTAEGGDGGHRGSTSAFTVKGGAGGNGSGGGSGGGDRAASNAVPGATGGDPRFAALSHDGIPNAGTSSGAQGSGVGFDPSVSGGEPGGAGGAGTGTGGSPPDRRAGGGGGGGSLGPGEPGERGTLGGNSGRGGRGGGLHPTNYSGGLRIWY